MIWVLFLLILKLYSGNAYINIEAKLNSWLFVAK